MSATPHNAADALTYIREALGVSLDSIHDTLAEAYGLDIIDGEEYLPGILNNVMALLYALHGEVTDECERVGDYRRDDGHLYRPSSYSNGLDVYTNPTPNCPNFYLLNHPSGELSTSAVIRGQRAGNGMKDGVGRA